ncbi:MAG: polysulfide reductase NrfD [Candidatus Eremiobacteraeota bacterium]|nr:polysulfide reductase NrfD [Candidatus Eremiobacteraeota bacterium]
MAEHFVQPPQWQWYIAFYFFFAGLAGGGYTLATMLRLWGTARDEATARLGFSVSFPLVILCAILLTVDLGHPLRFWHMLINTTPGAAGVNFLWWSPISIGSWALLIFGIFSAISFLEMFGTRGTSRPSGGMLAVNVLGSIFGLFLACYTGVVLSVSNQPIWSDSYAIGGLFVASALSSASAMLVWLSRYRTDVGAATEYRLTLSDGWFAILEILMIAAFFASLARVGQAGHELAGPWLILWLLVLISLVPPLASLGGGRRAQLAGGGTIVTSAAASQGMLGSLVVIVGVLLLRIVVIFSAQF